MRLPVILAVGALAAVPAVASANATVTASCNQTEVAFTGWPAGRTITGHVRLTIDGAPDGPVHTTTFTGPGSVFVILNGDLTAGTHGVVVDVWADGASWRGSSTQTFTCAETTPSTPPSVVPPTVVATSAPAPVVPLAAPPPTPQPAAPTVVVTPPPTTATPRVTVKPRPKPRAKPRPSCRWLHTHRAGPKHLARYGCAPRIQVNRRPITPAVTG